ncbi:hypothetical protein GKR72_14625 [Providencia stuartii]|uniref:DUF4142 domain-containing protein n=3 Tax=Morganellaceae TaxID=1903414 RepID=A0AA87CST0_PROST|nr:MULTISPECIES: hypothetical protein [Providencia]EDU58995.1 hypothetical protein PROSTU_02179 [Providencia stuartii ATCC 25827]MTC81952.1 hypothetical protein [Providencia stuartii]MTC94254.1 hypothetical protein [Providencia stuartii]
MNKVLFSIIATFFFCSSAVAQSQAHDKVRTHENALIALSFTENSTSQANQIAMARHAEKANIEKPTINGLSKTFLNMDAHEKAATALSFTENSQSYAVQRVINQHMARSQTK